MAPSLASAVYTGWIRHRRFAPRRNDFRYRLFMMYLDLDEIDRVFRGRWLWSAGRPNVASFRREDYLRPTEVPLVEAVRDRVEEETGRRPRGPIRFLTHLRYFGYCFNPVSFYYCFDERGDRVESIVADITNTPWGERHAYVLPVEAGGGGATRWRWRFRKDFHVSPFMGMEQSYDWRFTAPGRRLGVHMVNFEEGKQVFDATLTMERREISGPRLAACLLRHPMMTAEVVGQIHWQALKLWLKKVPYRPHPGNGGRRKAAA